MFKTADRNELYKLLEQNERWKQAMTMVAAGSVAPAQVIGPRDSGNAAACYFARPDDEKANYIARLLTLLTTELCHERFALMNLMVERARVSRRNPVNLDKSMDRHLDQPRQGINSFDVREMQCLKTLIIVLRYELSGTKMLDGSESNLQDFRDIIMFYIAKNVTNGKPVRLTWHVRLRLWLKSL